MKCKCLRGGGVRCDGEVATFSGEDWVRSVLGVTKGVKVLNQIKNSWNIWQERSVEVIFN